MAINNDFDYQTAKGLLESGRAKDPAGIRQKMAQWENKRNTLASNPAALEGPEAVLGPMIRKEEEDKTSDELTKNALTGLDSYLLNSGSDDAELLRSVNPQAMETKRQALEATKQAFRDEKLKNASKLKVFDTPPDYDPKPVPGQVLSSLSGYKPTTRYFEPTANEFRQVLAETPQLATKFREQYPDSTELKDIPDDKLTGSDAFGIYADARWQHALADAMKSRTPIKRVAFTDTDWMGGGQAKDANGVVKPNDRKPSLADLMDITSAAGTGALQGASMGLYDTSLSAIGADEMRDQGRGSVDRHPIIGKAGELAGALSKRGLPSRLVRAASKIGRPTSLIGRAAKAGAVGAGTAVLDENVRSAAKLASDAIDAEDSAKQAMMRIGEGLPGVRFGTAALGAGMGAGADIFGAGLGRVAEGAPKALDLQAPLQHLEASGGQLGPMGGPKLAPRAQAWANRGAKARSTAQDLISEGAVQPMARQAMLEQEAALRAANQETGSAQASLEGVTLPTEQTAEAIRAQAQAIRPVTPQARSQQKQLLEIYRNFKALKNVSPADLDEAINQIDDVAQQWKATKRSTEGLDAVSKQLRGLRDQFPATDEATDVITPTTDPESVSPVQVMPRPSKAELAFHKAAMQKAAANVTPEEAEAVRRFTHGYDESLRGMARGKSDAEIAAGNKRGEAHAREARESLPYLQSYMSKMPPATEIPYVYRGIVVSPEEAQSLLKSPTLIADPVSGAAATSASADPMVARSFVARNLEGDNVGVVLKLKHRSAVGTGQFASKQMQVEKELLLPGNAKFRVVKRYQDASNPGQYIIEAEEIGPEVKKAAGIRDAEGNVQPVEGYSELKARQHKNQTLQSFKNARALGLSDVTGSINLKAEPALASVEDKGLFSVKTPEEAVAASKPKVQLNLQQHQAIKNNIRKIARPDEAATSEEVLALAKRVGPGMERKLKIIQQLDDADKLAGALGHTINGVSARGGNVGAFFNRKQLFRAVPTLKSLAGGLPPKSSEVASGYAVDRLKEFIKKFPDRLPGAVKAGARGFVKGLSAKEKQTTFMPQFPSLNLRAGIPTRAIGAARDDSEVTTEDFSPEETQFWLRVIDNLTAERQVNAKKATR